MEINIGAVKIVIDLIHPGIKLQGGSISIPISKKQDDGLYNGNIILTKKEAEVLGIKGVGG